MNYLKLPEANYELGACLGALYMFREAGLRLLLNATRAQGCLAVSDLYCKKTPPPRETIEVFFEEGPIPLLENMRSQYSGSGLRILGEVACSQKAWLDYYDMTDRMLQVLEQRHPGDAAVWAEVQEARREAEVFRRYGEEYVGYMLFIMQKRES